MNELSNALRRIKLAYYSAALNNLATMNPLHPDLPELLMIVTELTWTSRPVDPFRLVGLFSSTVMIGLFIAMALGQL